MFNVGDIVEFAQPNPDEMGVTFTVIEMNGDRCFIQGRAINGVMITDTFLGQSVAMVADLRIAQ